MSILPRSRPALTRVVADALIRSHGVTGPALLGVRGYYRDTMGKAGQNDRALYDDAMFVVTPRAFAAFNANTDPSVEGGHVATLATGVWRFKEGIHHPGTPKAYPALVQAGPVTVHRDDGVTEAGEFYIHIHHGGVNGTSSLGCQTIPPDQWPEFFSLVRREIAYYEVPYLNYVLVDGPVA